jgi:hypothetical protein
LLRLFRLPAWHQWPSLGCGHSGFSLLKRPRLRGADQYCFAPAHTSYRCS